MNNKAAQKAVAYLCDSHNWHTKLANHKIAPILSFVASPIFLEMQDHLKIARKSFLCPAKNGAKVNEASKCFPVWQQSSFKDTSLTRVMPNDDRWEQYEYTLHRLYVHTSKPIYNSSFSLQNTLYPLIFAGWVRHEQFKVKPWLLASLGYTVNDYRQKLCCCYLPAFAYKLCSSSLL